MFSFGDTQPAFGTSERRNGDRHCSTRSTGCRIPTVIVHTSYLHSLYSQLDLDLEAGSARPSRPGDEKHAIPPRFSGPSLWDDRTVFGTAIFKLAKIWGRHRALEGFVVAARCKTSRLPQPKEVHSQRCFCYRALGQTDLRTSFSRDAS